MTKQKSPKKLPSRVFLPAIKEEEEPIESPRSESSSNTPDKEEGKKKKNRCLTCKKKVGLTGFDCRCGGLFCSIHRYSDKHECTYDYKQHGAEEIRNNNPVVKGDKVRKI